jgi:hypothetical protein
MGKEKAKQCDDENEVKGRMGCKRKLTKNVFIKQHVRCSGRKGFHYL